MQVTIRLYARTDPDLIVLSECRNFPMGNWMKKALQAYIRGNALSIPLPPLPPGDTVIADKRVYFTLNPEDDRDVIGFLQGLRPGIRSTVLKLLFRSALEPPFLEPFLGSCQADYPDSSRSSLLPGRSRPYKKKQVKSGNGNPRPDPAVRPAVYSVQETGEEGIEKQKFKAEIKSASDAESFDLFDTIGGMLS